MRRVVSLWFPMLPTDRLHLDMSNVPLDSPLVATDASRRLNVIADANQTARNLGICVGMSVAHAQALIPNLICLIRDPVKDTQTLTDLAAWALRYAPHTSAAPPDGLWIDATGSMHLHGGEKSMLQDIVDRLDKAGVHAQAAIAGTPGAAHGLARFSGERVTIVVPDGTTAVLNDLPVEALRLPNEAVLDLKQLGFDRIGQIAAAPRAPIVRRFGKELQLRLDQMFGRVFEPITPDRPPVTIAARLSFTEPLLTAESLNLVSVQLVGTITQQLEQAGLGAKQLRFCLERVDGSFQVISIGMAEPSRNAPHFVRLLRDRVEQIDPGLGIEAARLTAILMEPLACSQVSTCVTGEKTSQNLSPLMDCLTNRLGSERVYRPVPVETYIPERSIKHASPLERPESSWTPLFPRPTRLLAPPRPIQVIAAHPNRPPLAFVWRRALHRVCRSDGPERIVGEWWNSDTKPTAKRDYFAIEDEMGRRYWIFLKKDDDMGRCRLKSGWFLHGLF